MVLAWSYQLTGGTGAGSPMTRAGALALGAELAPPLRPPRRVAARLPAPKGGGAAPCAEGRRCRSLRRRAAVPLPAPKGGGAARAAGCGAGAAGAIPAADRAAGLSPDLRVLAGSRSRRGDLPPSTCNVGTLENLGKTLEEPGKNLGIARRSRAPEISETLEKPWETLGMVSGNIWAEARQRVGQEQTKGNIKEIQWSEGHWQNLGIASGNPWENLGKPWKPMGKPWENLGRTLESTGC
eukprot:gene17211-biopygen1688